MTLIIDVYIIDNLNEIENVYVIFDIKCYQIEFLFFLEIQSTKEKHYDVYKNNFL